MAEKYGFTTRSRHGYSVTSPNDPEKAKKAGDWLQQPGNINELMRPAGPKDTIHLRDEEEVPSYSKGGMVKHGSSTRVSCKNK